MLIFADWYNTGSDQPESLVAAGDHIVLVLSLKMFFPTLQCHVEPLAHHDLMTIIVLLCLLSNTE